MAKDPWLIHETASGYGLFYDGNPWPMEPKPSRQEAAAYLERVRKRSCWWTFSSSYGSKAMTDRDERIGEIRERLGALEYRAWAWEPFGEKGNNFIVGVAFDGQDQLISGRMPDDDDAIRIEVVCEKHDAVGYRAAEFISHAPQDIYWLLSEIDRLRARLSELEYAARSYVQSGAVNERDRLKAKLEGEDEQD